MMNDVVVLSSAYLAPVRYYAQMLRYPHVVVEAYDHYMKQTYRNRCVIDSSSGELNLTIPVEKSEADKCLMKDVRISDHGNWRHLHWNALVSSYRHSPFFEYYADDFRPFYEKKWTYLLDFNEELCRLVCQLLDIPTIEARTSCYANADEGLKVEGDILPQTPAFDDLRHAITPKKGGDFDADYTSVSYYQVFSSRHDFLPELSIVDLLFNMGPEGLLVLQKSYL